MTIFKIYLIGCLTSFFIFIYMECRILYRYLKKEISKEDYKETFTIKYVIYILKFIVLSWYSIINFIIFQYVLDKMNSESEEKNGIK